MCGLAGMKVFTPEMLSSGGVFANAGDMSVTVQTASSLIGKSPSISMINHSWFSSLKRPLKKKFFSKSSNAKENVVKAEYANQHQYYSYSGNRISKSAWDITAATSSMVSISLCGCGGLNAVREIFLLFGCWRSSYVSGVESKSFCRIGGFHCLDSWKENIQKCPKIKFQLLKFKISRFFLQNFQE